MHMAHAARAKKPDVRPREAASVDLSEPRLPVRHRLRGPTVAARDAMRTERQGSALTLSRCAGSPRPGDGYCMPGSHAVTTSSACERWRTCGSASDRPDVGG